MIVVLTGGTGGAKLVQGLHCAVAPENLTVIVNTADDVEWWGLHVSPDVDSILYALAGQLSVERGWGVEGDSFRCLERMAHLGQPKWFSLGDLDLATHLTRTNLLRSGKIFECGHGGTRPTKWESAPACCPCPTIVSRPCSIPPRAR